MRVLINEYPFNELALTEVTTRSTIKVNNASASTESIFYIDSSVDLVVTQTVDNPSGHILEKLSYTITVSNKGPQRCTNVVLTDILPPNVILSSITLSQGNYSRNNDRITFYLGTISKDASVYISITISPKVQGILKNTVSVVCNEHDINLNNNSCTKVTKIFSADP